MTNPVVGRRPRVPEWYTPTCQQCGRWHSLAVKVEQDWDAALALLRELPRPPHITPHAIITRAYLQRVEALLAQVDALLEKSDAHQ